MIKHEEVAFCKKRIIEQNKYINETACKKITPERKKELLDSAIGVRKKFRSRLVYLIGVFGYVHFKLYEE